VQTGYSTAGNIIGSGQQMQLSGLGTILNSQTQMAGDSMAASASGTAGVLGAVGGIGAAMAF